MSTVPRLADVAERLRSLVRKAGIPNEVAAAVLDAYHHLGADAPVAVRSSATAEDAADTSFAGMHETFTNVVGDAAVLDRLVDCWASLYGDRVISYRVSQGITDEPAIAVVVQRMVDSERAGVLFCADPSTGERDHIVIEGAFGLGEVVVSGQVEPDTYVLSKDRPAAALRSGRPPDPQADRRAARRGRARRPRRCRSRPSGAERRRGDRPRPPRRAGRRPLRHTPGRRVGDRRR